MHNAYCIYIQLNSLQIITRSIQNGGKNKPYMLHNPDCERVCHIHVKIYMYNFMDFTQHYINHTGCNSLSWMSPVKSPAFTNAKGKTTFLPPITTQSMEFHMPIIGYQAHLGVHLLVVLGLKASSVFSLTS